MRDPSSADDGSPLLETQMKSLKARLFALFAALVGPVAQAAYRNIPPFQRWVDRMLAPTPEQQAALARQREWIDEAEAFCAWAGPLAKAMADHAKANPPQGLRIIYWPELEELRP